MKLILSLFSAIFDGSKNGRNTEGELEDSVCENQLLGSVCENQLPQSKPEVRKNSKGWEGVAAVQQEIEVGDYGVAAVQEIEAGVHRHGGVVTAVAIE